MGQKLIVESIQETRHFLEESEDGKGKKLYVEGIFLMSEIFNKNRRKYPKNVMKKEVDRYLKEHVARGNAFGELGHPEGPTINPDRISHLIKSLKEDGNNYIGKAEVLDTPCGLTAQVLIKAGTLAVSSRGLGSVVRCDGGMVVQEDFVLATAADFVINPSAPDAFVEGLMEGQDWIWNPIKNEWMAEQIVKELHNTKKLDEAAILDKWSRYVASL